MQKAKVFKSSEPKTRVYNPRARIDAWYASSEWRDFRKRFIAQNPKCYACGRASEVIDHVQRHGGDFELFWKQDNFLQLCAKCHNEITARFDRNPRPGSQEKKMLWIAKKRELNSTKVPMKVILVPIK